MLVGRVSPQTERGSHRHIDTDPLQREPGGVFFSFFVAHKGNTERAKETASFFLILEEKNRTALLC